MRQIKSYIYSKVMQVIEWLYSIEVSVIRVGYHKHIAQENGDFNNVHAWTYGYLLKRNGEVAEEYGITVIYVDEAYTSSKCPLHRDGCGKRMKRGLFKCTTLNKVFNAAYNIIIIPSTARDRGNWPKTGPRAESTAQGNVAPNLLALIGILVL